ncbi:hypothetical protein J7K50_05280 [bacterium]|nr:hypothetical protein [bacterium]
MKENQRYAWLVPEFELPVEAAGEMIGELLPAIEARDIAYLRQINERWQKFAGEGWFFAWDVIIKCWIFVIGRNKVDWIQAIEARKSWLRYLSHKDIILQMMDDSASQEYARAGSAMLAFAASIAGNAEIFGNASLLAVRLDEPVETMAFFSAMVDRNERLMEKRFKSAEAAASGLGGFCADVIRQAGSKEFFSSLAERIETDSTELIALEKAFAEFHAKLLPGEDDIGYLPDV